MTELLDNGTQRHGGKEGEAADDKYHSDYEPDEHAIVAAERPKRTRDDVGLWPSKEVTFGPTGEPRSNAHWTGHGVGFCQNLPWRVGDR